MTNSAARRKDDDPSQSKTKWTFMAYMAKSHPAICVITPAILSLVILVGVWFIMNVSYSHRHGWTVTPRINVDVDLNLEKDMKK